MDGLLDDNINAVVGDPNGNIWVGTDKGLNIRFEGVWYYYEALLDISCKTIAVDKSGTVWVGTWGAGVIKLTSPQNLAQIFDDQCEDCNFVSAIHVDATNRVWAATFGGQVKLLAPNQQSFSTGLPGDDLSALSSDKWGNVWVGSESGTNVSRYNGGSFEEFPIGNFYVVNTIWALAEDGAGNMWIGMGYHGLLKYDGVAFRRIANDPPGDDFTALLRDKYGNLWVGTIDHGLYYHVIK
jgi:ligand-binding sensor domain-containing protein